MLDILDKEKERTSGKIGGRISGRDEEKMDEVRRSKSNRSGGERRRNIRTGRAEGRSK